MTPEAPARPYNGEMGRRSERRATPPSRWSALPPAAPALFVGRAAELRALTAGLRRVPVALVYGVGGIGKSALAYMVAGQARRPVVYRRVAEADDLVAVVDDLRRALAAGAIRDERDGERALAALAQAAEEPQALVLVDDLHLLPAADGARLVQELGRRLRKGRLLATSRERIARGDGPDRVEVTLKTLERDAASALWRSLDSLYGPSSGFDAAFRASTGNPLLLRRWHAGEVPSEDPLRDLVGRLVPGEQRAAALLALTPLRVPAARLVEAIGDDGRAVVASLVRKMIVEADATGLTVHDLLRPALRSALGGDELRALHAQLAAILTTLEVDPVVRGREVVRHLCAAEAWDDAGQFLLGAATEFFRLGAARDLLHSYEAIPPERRSRAVSIARARTLARAGSLKDAIGELERLRADGAAEPELDLALAQAAMLAGELQVAAQASDRALAQPLEPTQLVRARVSRALILTHLDRGDEARSFLEACEAATPQPKHRAHLALTRAFTLWLDERLGAGEAEKLIERARVLYDDGAGAYQAAALALPLVSAVLAHEGRADDARIALDQAQPILAGRSDDVLLMQDVQFLRAAMLFDFGKRHEALALFAATEQAFYARGNLLGARLAQVWRARIAFVLGRVTEARALVTDVSAVAAAMPSVRRTLERSRRYDPLAISSGGDPSPRPGLALRQRLLAALSAAAAGDSVGVRKRLARAQAESRGPGYALDRALIHLARARLAAALGDTDAAVLERRRADAEAADEADPGLIAQLAAAIGLGSDDGVEPVILDVDNEALRWGKNETALGQRPALRRLLYLLAPGTPVDKPTLATALWGTAYKPSTHDNALWVNMMRLRKLVAPAGLTVQTTETGYRLIAPAGLVVVGALPSGNSR
jgi:hypothetical protein